MKPKVKKITNNKQQQLWKKLEQIKQINELQNIMKIAKDKNTKLCKQVQELKQRVQYAAQKKILTEQLDERYEIQTLTINQITDVKKQLKTKYAKMKLLKEYINQKNNDKIQQVQNNKAKHINQIRQLQKEIEKAKKQIKDYEKANHRLEKTIENNNKEDNINGPRVNQIEQQNKQLRKKIAGLRKNDYQHQQQSKKVQNSLISQRQKFREHKARMSMFDLKTMDVLDKNELLKSEEVGKLKKQIQYLKKQKKQVQENEVSQNMQRKNKTSRLGLINQQRMKKLQELDLQRTKFQRENNLWKAKLAKINLVLEKQNSKKNSIQHCQTQINEYKDQKPLRKQFGGVLFKYRFNDRQLLRENKKTKIIGLKLYEKEDGIVGVQATYTNKLVSNIQVPQAFLQRCKCSKIQCKEKQFIKLMRVRFNKITNKINKIEIVTSNGVQYEFGNKKQWTEVKEGDTLFNFDINENEYPTCIFGSYNVQKGSWFLEGFGVQINQQ